MCMPGDNIEMTIELIHPIAMSQGLTFKKRNGALTLKTTGVSRSGCMYCMYGVHLEHEPNRFQLMEKTHPQQYHYCIHELGLGAVLDYIGVPYSCH